MHYRVERRFDYPREKVTQLLMETVEGAYDMSQLENVTMWKVIKEDDRGDKRVGVKEWCAHGQIPRALQHIITPKMLTWLEHSEWNRKTSIYTYRIEPFFMKKIVECHGKTIFKDKGGGKCSRIFEIELKVKIPVLGAIFENAVLDYLKKNEEQDYSLCRKCLDEKLGIRNSELGIREKIKN